MIPTPHIEEGSKDVIAKTVIMPGDPLRAEFIAKTYLKDVVKFNTVRNMNGYSGTYNGKKISVMGSGMGMPSIGIYSYELYEFYDVDNIIRIGSAGSYREDLGLYEVFLATSAYSESNFAKVALKNENSIIKSTDKLNDKIIANAEQLGIDLKKGVIHSSDVFYRHNFDDYKEISKKFDCQCVEMESFALFTNALKTGKNAACLVTISDNLVTGEVTSSAERQTAFTKMMEIALNLAWKSNLGEKYEDKRYISQSNEKNI